MSSMEYLVIIEEGPTGFSTYDPDLPGCVAAADWSEFGPWNRETRQSFENPRADISFEVRYN